MKILEFAFVGFPVTDMRRAREFYEKVLGLTPASKWGDDTKGWLEYEIGPHTLALCNFVDDWKPAGRDGACLGLEVDDFDAALAHLKAHQVKIVKEGMDSPVCRFAIVSDPDGNHLFIHKRKAVAVKVP